LQKNRSNNEDIESGWRTEIAIKFMETFQNNWQLVNEAITNLVKKADDYWTQIYNLKNIQNQKIKETEFFYDALEQQQESYEMQVLVEPNQLKN